MLRSMTGYGRKEATVRGISLALEMRSVNHRYLELGLRLPEQVRTIESRIREIVSGSVKRGKVDVSLKIQSDPSAQQTLEINHALAGQLLNAATEITGLTTHAGPVDPVRIMQWPGVVTLPEIDRDTLQTEVLKLLQDVLADFVASREREGAKTLAMLDERVTGIENIVAKVRDMRPEIVLRQTDKIKKRISELDIPVDHGRCGRGAGSP